MSPSVSRRQFNKLALLALAGCAVAISAPARAQQVFGLLRVFNPQPIQAQVFTLNLNPWGVPQWMPIAMVPPNSYVDLPNVPNGQQFGVQLANGRNLPPFNVFFPNPYNPYFEYHAQ